MTDILINLLFEPWFWGISVAATCLIGLLWVRALDRKDNNYSRNYEDFE